MTQQRIPTALIYGNPDQPRKTFEPTALQELADSITRNGLIQPITVRADGAGRYMIVAGERRWRAHQLAGLEHVDCLISTVDDTQLAINAIIENDQRVDVAPLEQARSYQRMIDLHGFTVETLATKLGKPQRRISERLVLLGLTDDCQRLLAAEQITPTQAWYLAMLPTRQQGQLLRAINAGQCRSTEQLAAVTDALKNEGAQDMLFAMPDPPSEAEQRTAATFESTLDRLRGLLTGAIDNNQVVAVRRVNPDRAGTIADLLAAMVVDVRRLETAFRVAAAGAAMEA